MAQDFERNFANGVGTSGSTLRTADSDDAIVGITIANVHTAQITVEVFITNSSTDYGSESGNFLFAIGARQFKVVIKQPPLS